MFILLTFSSSDMGSSYSLISHTSILYSEIQLQIQDGCESNPKSLSIMGCFTEMAKFGQKLTFEPAIMVLIVSG